MTVKLKIMSVLTPFLLTGLAPVLAHSATVEAEGCTDLLTSIQVNVDGKELQIQRDGLFEVLNGDKNAFTVRTFYDEETSTGLALVGANYKDEIHLFRLDRGNKNLELKVPSQLERLRMSQIKNIYSVIVNNFEYKAFIIVTNDQKAYKVTRNSSDDEDPFDVKITKLWYLDDFQFWDFSNFPFTSGISIESNSYRSRVESAALHGNIGNLPLRANEYISGQSRW